MSSSSKYQKLTQIEHVLKRPDTYVGSLSLKDSDEYIIDENDKMQKKKIKLSDAALKVFDEIIVNARDRLVESDIKEKCDIIKVSIENNIISVYNNGDGIPIEMHEKENVYIPQLIFGSLLTSSNYDDYKKRTAGGRNGYGSKLTNIFSKSFEIETVSNNKKYYQKFEKNLSVINKPKITKCSKKEYTKITFELDKFLKPVTNPEKLNFDYTRTLNVRNILENHTAINRFINTGDFKSAINTVNEIENDFFLGPSTGLERQKPAR